MKTVTRSTVMKDFQNILYSDFELYSMFIENKSESRYTHKETGSEIVFEGADQEGKVLGMTQDISFFNEVTEFNEAVYLQITQRTAETVFADYNPSKAFWLEKVLGKPNLSKRQFTYQDNAFCPPNIIEQLNSYNPWHPEDMHLPEKERRQHPTNIKNGTANKYMWLVYGEGKKAEIPGRVYSDWAIIDDAVFHKLPYIAEPYIDFGFVSPTAIGLVKFDGDRSLFVHEVSYTPISAMKEQNLIAHLDYLHAHNLINREKMEFTADSAGKKYIRKMREAGYNVYPSLKGNDSILPGIDDVKKFRIYMTKSSVNVKHENEVYSFEMDRYGKAMERTIAKDDHHMDGIRYKASRIVREYGIR